MEDCIGCRTPEEVREVVQQAVRYDEIGTYVFDPYKVPSLRIDYCFTLYQPLINIISIPFLLSSPLTRYYPSYYYPQITQEQKLKDALAHRKHEEGKRKAFEERMMRKAKREGKEPGHYLSIGAEVPTVEDLAMLRSLPKGEHDDHLCD